MCVSKAAIDRFDDGTGPGSLSETAWDGFAGMDYRIRTPLTAVGRRAS